MFGGPRITTVFASRWKAVWWAGMVLMTAYCSVPRQGEEQDPMLGTATALAGAAGVTIPGTAGKPPEHHVDPWAKDPPASAA